AMGTSRRSRCERKTSTASTSCRRDRDCGGTSTLQNPSQAGLTSACDLCFLRGYHSGMFDTLTDKFNSIFRGLSGRGKISEENIRESLREVRTALLEADVNFKVVNDFTDHVIQKAIGQEV